MLLGWGCVRRVVSFTVVDRVDTITFAINIVTRAIIAVIIMRAYAIIIVLYCVMILSTTGGVAPTALAGLC